MLITENPVNSQWIHFTAYVSLHLCFPLYHPLCHSIQGVWAYTTNAAGF